jgi:membrane protease YdiL (CAAX protease family)
MIFSEENTMKRAPLAERHPYRFVATLELAIVAVYLVAGTIASLQGRGGLWLYAFANIALTAIAAGMLTKMRLWGEVGFCRLGKAADLSLYAVALAPVALNLLPGVAIPGPLRLVGLLALALMVGFVEETFFRGMMLLALRPKGIRQAMTISTLLFGVTHLMNGLAGRGPVDLATQLAYTLAIGFAFAVIAVRTGVIWPLVGAHALIDFAVFLQPAGYVATSAAMIVSGIAVTATFAVYGVMVLRGITGGERRAVRHAADHSPLSRGA